MIADILITEKSFGDKSLMKNIKFSVDDGEKIGIIGRNGVGKTTLFGILTGQDRDFTGEIVYRRGVVVSSTAQEHIGLGDKTVLAYILEGLPEYSDLSAIIEEYPAKMGSDLRMIEVYTDALARFEDKGFYYIKEKIEQELDNFQLPTGIGRRTLATMSGGQKRLIEIIKIMHSDADLAMIDEPTNHMDFVAKQQFIDWMKSAREAMLIITHDRDVLKEVDRIVELKDGLAVSYRGNYDAYLQQNAHQTASGMTEFEHIEKRITNLKQKVIDYQRLKEKSRNPGTIQKFKRLEMTSRQDLADLEAIDKPSFWIDKGSVDQLDYKSAARYGKFKARNIKMSLKDEASRSKHVLVKAVSLSLGYGDQPLFDGVNIDLREGESVELRGRNGAGKTTLITALLAQNSPGSDSGSVIFGGEISLDKSTRIGIYQQEIAEQYLGDNLGLAIEKLYLSGGLSISNTKIRQLAADYLFTEADLATPLARLSGGQKARFQLISMLANEPQLLVLDEPTNHLDLPSIEELETSLQKYSGAIIFVSHDNYFRQKIGGQLVLVGKQ